MVKGYKVFDANFKCRDFQYKIGERYKHQGSISVCNSGFHFCEKLVDCYNYYDFNSNNKIAEIIAHGNIQKEKDKSCTDDIEIIKEISWNDCLNIVNTGDCNTGHSNTGDRNTGDWNAGNRNTGDWNTGDSNTGHRNTGNRNTGHRNTGDSNTGDWNTGDSNTGYWNTGDSNTGHRNTGDWNTGGSNTGDRNTGDSNTGYSNTGDRNTGDSNTGDWNTGDRNTGYSNTGDRNTGYRNTGDRNTGDRNTGDWNTGYRNTGDRNTGDRNTGDWNTGDRNAGNRNTGDWNTGDLNKCNNSSGVLCTKDQKILIFDLQSDMTIEEWRESNFSNLFYDYCLTAWVYESEMTEQEKIDHPKFYVQGGFLKVFTPEVAWSNWFKNKSKEDIELIKQIPNFDNDKFKYITGIDLTKDNNE